MKESREPPYIFEWRYKPAGYFEGPVAFIHDGVSFTASDGVARAELPADRLTDAKMLRTQLHTVLEHRFLVRQLVTHRSFELPMPGLSRTHPDGRQDAYAFADGAAHLSFSASAEILVIDADGNVVQDTKRDRMAREARLAELIARHRSQAVVAKVLRSRRTASQDSANELVHLAEIEEAMTSYFGSERKARAALEMTKSDWDGLTKAANDPSNPVGRHRGRHLEALPRLSRVTMNETRRVAALMIERFLEFLDGQPHP